jgi:hypothetical protein
MKRPLRASFAALVLSVSLAVMLTGVGLYCGARVIAQTAGWMLTRGYVPVEAEVASATIAPAPLGSALDATFSYSCNGVACTTKRVTLNDFGEPYKRGLYKSLYAARTLANPVTLWVDPANPQHAIYDRQFRALAALILLAAMALCLGGALIVGLFAFILLQERGRTHTPPEPGGRTTVHAARGDAWLAPLALVVNLYAWPNALLAMEASRRFAEPGGAVPYLALVAGLAMLGVLWRTRHAERALGTTVLKLQVRHEASGAAQLQGRLHFDPPLGQRLGANAARQQVTVTLQCQAEDRSIPPTNWPVLAQQLAGGTRHVDLPVHLPAGRDLSDRWRLVLVADGVTRRFALPVAQLTPPAAD